MLNSPREPEWDEPAPERTPLSGVGVMGVIAGVVLALAFILWTIGVAFGQAPEPPDTRVNIGPAVGWGVDAVKPWVDTGIGVAITALVTWGMLIYERLSGRKADESHRATLEKALTNGAKLISQQVLEYIKTKSNITIDVKVGWIADIIRPHVEKGAADAIRHFNLTSDDIDRRALGEVNALIFAAETGVKIDAPQPAVVTAA